MNASIAHFATLCKYAGISFIAGAVNHGFFSGERSLLTAAIGVLAYLVGGVLEMRAHPESAQRWSELLGVGVVSSIGLGFFTGGLQHFPDSPARSAWVVPLGFVMSFAAFWWAQRSTASPGRTLAAYGAGMTAAVTLACVLAWNLLGEGAGDHDHASHAHGAAQTPALTTVTPQTTTQSASATTAEPGSTSPREVRIEMDDTMRFTPSAIELKAGEPVRLVVVNRGKLRHELVLGTEAELAHHAREMKSGSAAHHHDDNAIEVEPGQTKTVTRVFTQTTQLGMACFEPGHFEAGMRGTLKVVPGS